MSTRERALLTSLNLFIWSRFVYLNLISGKILVSNLYPSLLLVNMAVSTEFNVMVYFLRNLHSFYIQPSVSSIPYFLKVSVNNG